MQQALAQLERQQARLLEVYLAEVIGRDEFERKRHEVARTQQGLQRQLRELDAQAQQRIDLIGLADGLTAFCQRIASTLEELDFTQRRHLVELLIGSWSLTVQWKSGMLSQPGQSANPSHFVICV